MKRILIPQFDAPPARSADGRVHGFGGEAMGTTWSVRLVAPVGASVTALGRGVQGVLHRLEQEMSPWIPGSDLCVFADAEPDSWVATPPCFWQVLSTAMTVAEVSRGAFDPTMGALTDLWGFGPSGPRHVPPQDDEIAAALALGGWRRLLLKRAGRRALQPGGMRLDVCGVAKGYAVDEIARFLRAMDIKSYLVEVGGELSGQGAKPDGSPWWVDLERPPGCEGATTTMIALHGLSVATSGDYRRGFDHEGRRYAHTLDPRTGRPLSAPPASVTVIHPSCMLADAWATALTVLGPQAGMALAENQKVAALFLSRQPEEAPEQMTSAFLALLD